MDDMVEMILERNEAVEAGAGPTELGVALAREVGSCGSGMRWQVAEPHVNQWDYL